MAPEGTRAAIMAAVRAGADMVELDVQMTRDQRLVIFHDARVERTTNGVGYVRDLSAAQFVKLDAGSWFHPRFAGERPLLLSQVFQVLPRRVGLNLELKRTPQREGLIRRVKRLLRPHQRRPGLLISSFDAALLHGVWSTGLSLALICSTQADRSLRQAIRLGCRAWHPRYSLVTPRRVAMAHAAGLRVHPWTVDRPRLARRLMRWGIDGLFTNHPARLRRALRASR